LTEEQKQIQDPNQDRDQDPAAARDVAEEAGAADTVCECLWKRQRTL